MKLHTLVIGTAFALSATASDVDSMKGTAQGLSEFGFKLFAKLSAETPKESIAISPMSIGEAMTMATAGSEKETLKKMEEMLLGRLVQADAGVSTLVDGLRQTRESLNDYAKRSDGAFIYSSANSLWGNTNPTVGFKFNTPYVNRMNKEFGATLNERDFAAAGVVDEMNTWVAAETKDKITKLINKLERDSVAVLMNAIYAKGKFVHHFGLIDTQAYTSKNGQRHMASFLTQENEHGQLFSNKEMKMISLPIGTDKAMGEVALDIIVPQGDINTFKSKLNAKKYADAVKGLEHKAVALSIAAGKVEQAEAKSLRKAFISKEFGIERAFSGQAEFAPMGTVADGSNIAISDVITKTFYETTPFGFEAAAATAVVMMKSTSIQPMPRFEKIVVDKPSIHVVRHVKSGLPLFIVEYDAPKNYSEKEIVDFVKLGYETRKSVRAVTNEGTIQVAYNEKKKKSVVGVVNNKGVLVKELAELK